MKWFTKVGVYSAKLGEPRFEQKGGRGRWKTSSHAMPGSLDSSENLGSFWRILIFRMSILRALWVMSYSSRWDWKQGNQLKGLAESQVKNNKGLKCGLAVRMERRGLFGEEGEFIELEHNLDVGSGKERRAKDYSQVPSLGNCMDGSVIHRGWVHRMRNRIGGKMITVWTRWVSDASGLSK